MLHGLFGDADNLRGLGTRLAAGLDPDAPDGPGGPDGGAARTVHRLDLPGHGGRAATDPLDQRGMADAVADDLRALGDAPVHLLGHSLGGKVAMALAARADAPPLASITVLDIAPRAYPPHHARIIDALRAVDPTAIGSRKEIDAALADAIPTPGVRAFLLKGLERIAGPDGPAFRWRFDLERIARDYPHLSAAPPTGPPRALPALFLHGADGDYVDPARDTAAILERFPHAIVEAVPGAGHWLHAERPDAVAAACARHLAAADAALAPPA